MLGIFGNAVHADQGELDLLVSGSHKAGGFLLYENAVDQICVLLHRLEEAILSRCLIVGYRRLHEVSSAVKLVTATLGKAAFGLYYSIINVKIAVLPLMRHNIVDQPFYLFFQLRIRMLGKNIRRPLHPLCHVAVPKDVRLIFHALFPGAIKGGDAPRIVKAIVDGVHGHRAVFILHSFPKSTGNIGVVKSNILHDPISLITLINTISQSEICLTL